MLGGAQSPRRRRPNWEIISAFSTSTSPAFCSGAARLEAVRGGGTETVYQGDDALSTKHVVHYQGTAYLYY